MKASVVYQTEANETVVQSAADIMGMGAIPNLPGDNTRNTKPTYRKTVARKKAKAAKIARRLNRK